VTNSDKEFQDRINALRRWGPTWANLRAIGNSRPVQIATIFPVVGYLVLLSSEFTRLIDGGLAGSDAGLFTRLWSLKLYFVYFGLVILGIGSGVYQLRCPRIVKQFSDNAEYVRVQGDAIGASQLYFMAQETVMVENLPQGGYVRAEHRIPTMTNYYALQSAIRPASRVFTTFLFSVGFALLAVPSMLTFLKVAGIFWHQLWARQS
jgi:hypothetical protein